MVEQAQLEMTISDCFFFSLFVIPSGSLSVVQ